VRTEA